MTALRILAPTLGTLGFLLASSPAPADDPKFEYGKKEEVKKEEVKDVEWKASAQAGLIATTGNSRATTGAAGAKASRKAGKNKVEGEASGAYVRSSIYLANDADGSGDIDAGEITRPASTSTQSWLFKSRYDRFLTEHNSLYVTGVISGDKPAGKDFVGGGQVGYSRQLYKDECHLVKGEIGYDFSYEDLTVGNGTSIHSARFFIGYEGKVSNDTGVLGSVESLHNVNSLDTAAGKVKTFEDTRVNATLALTTKLLENISFRFGFTARFDNAPAPRPPLPIPYEDGFVPLADELDTKTEATLIINFL